MNMFIDSRLFLSVEISFIHNKALSKNKNLIQFSYRNLFAIEIFILPLSHDVATQPKPRSFKQIQKSTEFAFFMNPLSLEMFSLFWLVFVQLKRDT